MKQFLQRILIKLGADYAQTPCVIRTSAPNFIFFRDKVKLHPIAVSAGNDALGTENDAVFFRAAQLLQYLLQLFCRIFMSRLHTPACENLICMVVAFMLMMVMIVTAAGTVLIVLVVVFMTTFAVVVMMFMCTFFFVMMMLTFTVMMMTMFTFTAVVMRMTARFFMVMMVILPHFKLRMVHGFQNLPSVQFIPRCGDHGSMSIMLPKKSRALLQLFICHTLGSAYDNGSRMLHLVIEKFTEVFHIHLTLFPIHYDNGAVNVNIHGAGHIFHSLYHVGKLAHTGRLDENPIRRIGIQNLFQSRTEISYQ